MKLVKLDKIASAVSRATLADEVEVGSSIASERGRLVVVQALEENDTYGDLEVVGGKLVPIRRGDMIAGVLGERQALKGFVGSLPTFVRPGDTLHILNMGGVIGLCTSVNSDFGAPVRVRVVGSVLVDGKPANLADYALTWKHSLSQSAPIILVSGTCMNAGKTTAASEIVRLLSHHGYRVAAAKLAGVATQRDLLNMQAHGAIAALSFNDAGLPSTTHTDSHLVHAAKGVLAELNRSNPDAILVELGDGIMGHYGVDLLLKDRELMSHVRAHVFCANDLVGAWGGLQLMGQLGLEVDCICGPVTDNSAGIDYVRNHFGKPAVNARNHPEQLGPVILAKFASFDPRLKAGELAYNHLSA
ncbi:MAG: hypothetical protein M3328_02595 [Chloroflexota bacterium]|nr:hypothetical protein [Chloroflexota bacterium]